MTGTIRPHSSATAIPMFTSLWKTIESPSTEALTIGTARSASIAALMMNDM